MTDKNCLLKTYVLTHIYIQFYLKFTCNWGDTISDFYLFELKKEDKQIVSKRNTKFLDIKNVKRRIIVFPPAKSLWVWDACSKLIIFGRKKVNDFTIYSWFLWLFSISQLIRPKFLIVEKVILFSLPRKCYQKNIYWFYFSHCNNISRRLTYFTFRNEFKLVLVLFNAACILWPITSLEI